MINSTGGRLSPYNISDSLIRVELYREIRQAQEDSSKRTNNEWGSYIIQPADILSPELIAYKVYAFDQLKWVICIAASLDDTRERLEAGKTIYLPTVVWIREKIKYYQGMCSS